MAFRYDWGLIECKCGIEGFSSFQSGLSHVLGYWGPFFLQAARMGQIPKARITDQSDDFSHFRETSLDTRWEVEHFRLFFIYLAAGLVDVGPESLNFSNASNTKKQM